MNRSTIREYAFKLIYSNEIQKSIEEEQIKVFLQENNITGKEQIKYINDCFYGIKENTEDINVFISKNLKENWTIERISKIDISILKLAIYEMLYVKLPYKVVIDEAVKLAKKYGDAKSKSFVNGILASIVKEKNIGN